MPFSLIRAFLFSLVSAGSESHSSISCILLVILGSVVSVHLPRFSISSWTSVCVFFIAPISVFNYWTVSITCLIVFSWFPRVSFTDLLITSTIFILLIHFFTHFFKLFVSFLIQFFKGVIHILFKELYCYHNGTFSYFWIKVFKSFHCRVTGIWCFLCCFSECWRSSCIGVCPFLLQMLIIGSFDTGLSSLVGQGLH